jgi:hypothetical protein
MILQNGYHRRFKAADPYVKNGLVAAMEKYLALF